MQLHAMQLQRLQVSEEGVGTGDVLLRAAVELLQTLFKQGDPSGQQIKQRLIRRDQVRLEGLDQTFQRCSQLGDRHDTRHVGAALECVQGTLQDIADRPWQLLLALTDKGIDLRNMTLGFVTEDIQQDRIEPVIKRLGLCGFLCAGLGRAGCGLIIRLAELIRCGRLRTLDRGGNCRSLSGWLGGDG